MLHEHFSFNYLQCYWIELPAGKYHVRNNDKKMSRCQLEVDIAWDEFISHPCEGIVMVKQSGSLLFVLV